MDAFRHSTNRRNWRSAPRGRVAQDKRRTPGGAMMASSTWWRAQAASCRSVAREEDSPRLRSILVQIAQEYEARAEADQGAGSRAGIDERPASGGARPRRKATA